MFYRPQDGHGLPHNPFPAIIAPRPIGWISTRGTLGDNLAPYSFFNATAYVPPQIMFASTNAKDDRPGTKDSMTQIAESHVFCVNIADYPMRDKMNASSATYPAGPDEFAACGIARAECETINCPRVQDAPAALECRASQILHLAGEANYMVLGVVTGIHIRDDCLRDGRFDLSATGWLSRMGYKDYTVTRETFEMERP